jgi:8-oxo-dGTP diphosphatase
MPYCPILSTLGYVLSADRRQVLLTHRVGRRGDEQFSKYNGLGGRMEPGEDLASCMVREIREEAGIEVVRMHLRGTLNWTGFGPAGQDWFAAVFLVEEFRGKPRERSEEGPLAWVDIERAMDLPMWAGDRLFLPLVFDADPRPFHGYMPYENDQPRGWSFQRF